MAVFILAYLLVPIAYAVWLKNYQTSRMLWLILLSASIFLGISPLVAAVYLFVVYKESRNPQKTAKGTVAYGPDGSYTVYKVEDTMNAPSAGRTAFKIIGGLIAGLALSFGLLIVGMILLFTLAPSIACGGSSKCY